MVKYTKCLPDNVKNGLKIIPVSDMEEVLKIAIVRQPIAIDWEEPADVEASPVNTDTEENQVVTH